MKTTKICAGLSKIICCALLLGSLFCGVKAQCNKEITIKSIDRTDSLNISVTIKTPQGLTPAQEQTLQNKKNWLVFNPEKVNTAATAKTDDERKRILSEMVVPVTHADLDFTAVNQLNIPKAKIEAIEVKLILGADLADSLNYLVKINNLTAPNCLQVPFAANAVSDAGGKKKPKKIVLGKAKGRADADIYIQGLAEGARKEKTYFTVDALIKRRFGFSRSKRNFIEPFFELKTSTSKKADPNSANIGINYVRTVGGTRKFLSFSGAVLTNGIKLETDTDFKSVNLVYQTRANLNFARLNYANGKQTINVIPFIGFELGRNYKSPVAEAKNKLIARPLFGANLYFLIFQNESNDKAVSFETQYTRRLLLKPEVAFELDDNDNFVALPIGRRPRDYVKSTLNFDFAKNFAFSTSYEYGSLPPKFSLVNSKFSVGLTFKGKFGKEE